MGHELGVNKQILVTGRMSTIPYFVSKKPIHFAYILFLRCTEGKSLIQIFPNSTHEIMMHLKVVETVKHNVFLANVVCILNYMALYLGRKPGGHLN